MTQATKIWLITAGALVLAGLGLLTVALAAAGWKLNRIGTMAFETNAYPVTDAFTGIQVDTDTADIRFVLADQPDAEVVCYELEKERHTVSVQNGTLTVEAVNTMRWYDRLFSFTFSSPRITVYLPRAEYAALTIDTATGNVDIPEEFRFSDITVSTATGDVTCRACAAGTIRIRLSTGDIDLANVQAKAVELSVSTGTVDVASVTCEDDMQVTVSTGRAKLSDVTCRSIISTGSTGDLLLHRVMAAERFSLKRSTGDIRFDHCDAGEIYAKTNTGSVTGTLLTEKVFITETDVGRVTVPKTTTGGRCEIITNTGDIRISLA